MIESTINKHFEEFKNYEFETIFPREWPIHKHIIGISLLFALGIAAGYGINSAINYFSNKEYKAEIIQTDILK